MYLLNDGWEFSRQPLHTTLEEMSRRQEMFAPVGLPHDWLIYNVGDLYEDGTGWYRRGFVWEGGERLAFLRFDGIYMDSTVYVNGQKAGEWKYGYSAFEVDITPFLRVGDNEVWVSVDFQSPNSRWYSGAGIYRDVWMRVTNKEHLMSDSIYFSAKVTEGGVWKAVVEAEAAGADGLEIKYEISETGSGVWAELSGQEYVCREQNAQGQQICKFRLETDIQSPKVWDLESPERYRLRVTLARGGEVLDRGECTVGFRSTAFSPDEGFLLNGRKVKLNGVCEHHDLGCLGSAYHTKAMRRKFLTLKKMGVNAVRLTHNMPAADVMDLADEMGILIVSEAFDMWESSKTTYDYARFFPEWYKKDTASWVRRDRNHPSLIMWSIGNEIYDTHVSEKGQMWTRLLAQEVEHHDPAHNGAVTLGSNYMPWENAQKCADIVKIAGYNYGEKYYDQHHREHPDWVIYGSETSSTVQSRGIYHFPYQQSVLADEDEQCSSLGNSTTSWGAKSTEACIIAERDHAFSCGQFLWTGFDYIGEPTPYHTRNSYFGQVDTAGFPKDSYYLYQAEWTDYRKSPMVHIFPYWDFNDGQLIDVRVCSNAPVVELFFNGKSQGTYAIDHLHGEQLAGHWQLPYAEGEIRAVACDENGRIVAEETRHSFGEPAKICLKPEQGELTGDGNDLLFVEISMEDENGYPVENADNRVHVQVEGPGFLAGLDNGDSTDTDGYKTYSRRLFSGKLLAVFRAGDRPGKLVVTVSSRGLADAVLEIPVLEAGCVEGTSPIAYLAGEDSGNWDKTEIPVRNIRLSSSNGLHLYPENPMTVVCASLCPENATDREVIWSLVDDAGIPSTNAVIEAEGMEVKVTGKSDGQCRLRCMSRCGTGKVRVISQLEFMVTGLGKAFRNPYEFVSAGLYDYSRGAVGNGNEHGVATARDGESQVGFFDLDFGSYGADEIVLPIFALTDEPYPIKIYEGMPGEEGTELVADVVYQKPSVWNVYQEETYKLNRRLKGVTSLCFVLEQKIHLKGFSFRRINRAWEQLPVSGCDKIYGDSFLREEDVIRRIGNNVTIEFGEMDFGEKGARSITVSGSTPLEKNTIILRFEQDGAEERQILEFEKEKAEQTFTLDPVCGRKQVSFVFLPGSNFDFRWFRFGQK